jgi:hypothetical protein
MAQCAVIGNSVAKYKKVHCKKVTMVKGDWIMGLPGILLFNPNSTCLFNSKLLHDYLLHQI